jgi:hypothetical protein
MGGDWNDLLIPLRKKQNTVFSSLSALAGAHLLKRPVARMVFRTILVDSQNNKTRFAGRRATRADTQSNAVLAKTL